jgi:putative ABC transport system permease protein
LVVRATADPASILAGARTIVADVDRRLAPYDAARVDDMLAHSAASPRLYGLVSLSCALVALLLAAVGLYGVLAYSVGSRTREFGIRMALGARSHRVMWNVLREGLWLALLGLGIGLAGSYAAAQSLRALLFGVTPQDGTTFVTTASLLLITAACACYLPSRRATHVDPVIALRSE